MADVVIPANKEDQGVTLRVPWASRCQTVEADINVQEQKLRDVSVQPGHDGEMPRSTFAALH
ncbi:uncharacterized protein LACBIDRAFT_296599 [Laccaria bicolor S238N-H82]|uniref:Predicted protein n=1 Tax=Laccaria bicolor (strain S238N-H82 / ATCC MYA-4686) TaxID=486041 RepID=B0D982_LACBS|nr:uncharacterized protein LACBIDRAFT_296599 [Laccaria bicolor S238N-H82]EDR08967.1 predicted protein [Laccaria bicolor S238N-H82]|eukprot:XP_001880280.1 predicted protein [Laccaria bicolor S238N-H82]